MPIAPAIRSLPARRAPQGRQLRPLDPPRADEPGPTPYRVLAVGGWLLAGFGVHTHSLALTGTIARSLASRVSFGVGLRSVLVPDTAVETIRRALQDVDLTLVDAVVLITESLPSPWVGEQSVPSTLRLLEELSARMTPAGSITFVSAPPGAGMSARRVEDHVARIRQHASALIRFQQLGRHPSAVSAAARFAAWGDAIAKTVAGSLIDPIATFPSGSRGDESPW